MSEKCAFVGPKGGGGISDFHKKRISWFRGYQGNPPSSFLFAVTTLARRVFHGTSTDILYSSWVKIKREKISFLWFIQHFTCIKQNFDEKYFFIIHWFSQWYQAIIEPMPSARDEKQSSQVIKNFDNILKVQNVFQLWNKFYGIAWQSKKMFNKKYS